MTLPLFGLGLDLGVSPQITVPPGDPDALAAAARVYAGAAAQFDGFAQQVRGTTRGVIGADWFGIAAISYSMTADDASNWLANANDALSLAASALATYAIELRNAQDTARAAQSAAAELDTAATHLQHQVANDPMQSLGILHPTTTAAADLIAQGRSKAASMGAEAQRMAHAAATKAAGAFQHAAGMTMAGRIAAARAAQQAQKSHHHSSGWGLLAVGGLGLLDAGLTVVNAAQLGLDPVTDGAEVATVGATAEVGADVLGGAATVEAGTAADAALSDVAAEEVATQVSSKPEWLVRVQEGTRFNLEQGVKYEERGGVNELYVNKPESLVTDSSRYYRVDSYLHDEEIVSRKLTQLGDVNESTARGYVRELYDKYQPGRGIADVPSTPEALRGLALRGEMVLEVPVQTTAVPQSVLDLADELNITIRDVNGMVYGP